MSDGDTREVNDKVMNDRRKLMVPGALFKSFSRSDQIWVVGAIIFLIVLINIVFAGG